MKNILLVIDMQKDFIDGALGTPEAEQILPKVIEKMKTYSKENIYATRDTHFSNYMETQEGKHLPIAHCIKGSEGWQLQKDVAALVAENHIIDKLTFGSVELMEKMAELAEKEEISLELIGVCTDICVISNALCLKAKLPEVPICVDASCCAGVTWKSHSNALEAMKLCQITITGEKVKEG